MADLYRKRPFDGGLIQEESFDGVRIEEKPERCPMYRRNHLMAYVQEEACTGGVIQRRPTQQPRHTKDSAGNFWEGKPTKPINEALLSRELELAGDVKLTDGCISSYLNK